MNEPEWARFGYTRNGYSGECECCGVVAELQFGEDEKSLLTFKQKDADFDQDELLAFVQFFTLLKLERVCDCEREPPQDLNMWSA